MSFITLTEARLHRTSKPNRYTEEERYMTTLTNQLAHEYLIELKELHKVRRRLELIQMRIDEDLRKRVEASASASEETPHDK